MTTAKTHCRIATGIAIVALGAAGWAWREHERMLEAERAEDVLKREGGQWQATRQAQEFQLARAECAVEELKASLKTLEREVRPGEKKDMAASANAPKGTGKNGSWVHAIRSDPEVQALEVATARGRMETQFGLFCKKLGLPPAQQEKFYENLMTREARVADVRAAGEAKDIADTDEIMSRLTMEAFTVCDTAQRELLGEAGYNQMKDYVAALPAREMVSGLAVVTTAAGIPLSPEQMERLVPLLREKTPAENFGMIVKEEDSSWERMDTVVRGVLTDEQFTLFKTVELRGTSVLSRFMKPLYDAIEQGRQADAAAAGGARPGGG